MKTANMKHPQVGYCHYLNCEGRSKSNLNTVSDLLRFEAQRIESYVLDMCYQCTREGKMSSVLNSKCEHSI